MKNSSESLILFLIIGCILGFPILLGLSTLFPKLWGNQNLGHGIYLTWSGSDDKYIMSRKANYSACNESSRRVYYQGKIQ